MQTIAELAEDKSVRGRSFWDVIYVTILTTEQADRELPWWKKMLGIKEQSKYSRDFEILRKLWLVCDLLPCSVCKKDFEIRLYSLAAVMEIYNIGVNLDSTIAKLPYPYNTIITSEGVDWFQLCAVAHNNINGTTDRTKEKLLKHIKSERQFRLD